MNTEKLLSHDCPCCGTSMRTIAMMCPSCGTEIKGRFHQNLFQLLSNEDRDLLEKYLLAGFNIKALEKRTGMGYAAIRTRLDRLIASYEALKRNDDQKKEIMNQVATGKLNASEAAELIRRMAND